MEHIVTDKQSLIDIALMYYGNIDAVFAILQNNSELNFDSPIVPGTKIKVELDKTNDFARYFDKNKIEISTGINEFTELSAWILATNYWRDHGIWKDTEFWQD